MKRTLLWYWWDIRYLFANMMDAIKWFVAFRCLPRWLVYLATVRLMSHGTTGKYSATYVDDVRAVTLMKRWGAPNV